MLEHYPPSQREKYMHVIDLDTVIYLWKMHPDKLSSVRYQILGDHVTHYRLLQLKNLTKNFPPHCEDCLYFLIPNVFLGYIEKRCMRQHSYEKFSFWILDE